MSNFGVLSLKDVCCKILQTKRKREKCSEYDIIFVSFSETHAVNYPPIVFLAPPT